MHNLQEFTRVTQTNKAVTRPVEQPNSELQALIERLKNIR